MAQPLAQSEQAATSGIDAAAVRLEHAFGRLETAVTGNNAGHTSLKADREKLNLLLREANAKITELKAATATVVTRLDRAIGTLEKMDE